MAHHGCMRRSALCIGTGRHKRFRPALREAGRTLRGGGTSPGLSMVLCGCGSLAHRHSGGCPSRAWMQGRRSDLARSRVEPGVNVTWRTRAQQGFHGPHSVRHPCRYARRDGAAISWAIPPPDVAEAPGIAWPSVRTRIARVVRLFDARTTGRRPLTTGAGGALQSVILRGIVSRCSRRVQ
jgi:hypothetical protein